MKNKQYPLHHDHGTVTISRDVFESMAAELERLRPMEASLELAEANRDAYKKRVEELTAEHHKERHEYIDMVAQLKAKLVEQESENHKLKRALWLARADRAHVTTLLWNVYCYQNNCLYFRDFMNEKCNPFRDLPKKTAMEWSDLWESIETKCRAKAEEYK